MTKHNTPTIVPASYPALESEVYNSLDCILDRDTLMPPSAELEELVAESVRAK
jgi:hypothetical protein